MVCACADKGHLDQDCEIAIDLKYWMNEVSCKLLECAWEAIFSTNLNEPIHAALL